MWSQLQAYHDQHSDECIITLQEKNYSCKLRDDVLTATYISTLQKLAKQLTDLQQNITEQQLISKIKCGLPFVLTLNYLHGTMYLLQSKPSLHLRRGLSNLKGRFMNVMH